MPEHRAPPPTRAGGGAGTIHVNEMSRTDDFLFHNDPTSEMLVQ